VEGASLPSWRIIASQHLPPLPVPSASPALPPLAVEALGEALLPIKLHPLEMSLSCLRKRAAVWDHSTCLVSAKLTVESSILVVAMHIGTEGGQSALIPSAKQVRHLAQT
jgi:hypothetical protein